MTLRTSILFVCLALLVMGCKSTVQSPQSTVATQSAKSKAASATAPSALIPPPESLATADSRIQRLATGKASIRTNVPQIRYEHLYWNVSTASNTTTEVWETHDLTLPFQLVGTTNGGIWPMDIRAAPAGFYKIRAQDTNTGAVSPWATTNS